MLQLLVCLAGPEGYHWSHRPFPALSVRPIHSAHPVAAQTLHLGNPENRFPACERPCPTVLYCWPRCHTALPTWGTGPGGVCRRKAGGSIVRQAKEGPLICIYNKKQFSLSENNYTHHLPDLGVRDQSEAHLQMGMAMCSMKLVCSSGMQAFSLSIISLGRFPIAFSCSHKHRDTLSHRGNPCTTWRQKTI